MSRCVGCCSWPNGCVTIAPCLLSIVAFILTSISLWSCQYAETSIDDSLEAVGVGLIYREVTDPVWYDAWFASEYGDGACTSYALYSDFDLDGKIEAAWGFGLVAWICGFIMTIVAFSIAPCVAMQKGGWRVIGGLFFLIGEINLHPYRYIRLSSEHEIPFHGAGLSQAFTLLILSSNVCSRGCSLNNAGMIAIVAFLLWWFIAGICCFMIPDADLSVRVNQQNAPVVVAEMAPVQNEFVPSSSAAGVTQQTVSQHVEPDGTTVIERVTTKADGGISVTTERIPPARAVPTVAVPPDAAFEKR